MVFTAFIRKSSEVFRRWRNEARLGGTISGVMFMWDGRDYRSDDPLSPDDVAAIKNNSYVQLVLATTPVGEVAVAPSEPAESTEPVVTQPKARVTLTLPQKRA